MNHVVDRSTHPLECPRLPRSCRQATVQTMPSGVLPLPHRPSPEAAQKVLCLVPLWPQTAARTQRNFVPVPGEELGETSKTEMRLVADHDTLKCCRCEHTQLIFQATLELGRRLGPADWSLVGWVVPEQTSGFLTSWTAQPGLEQRRWRSDSWRHGEIHFKRQPMRIAMTWYNQWFIGG